MDPVTKRAAEHRKKVKHYDREGDAHFLTFSCYRRLPLLWKDRTRGWLVDAMDKARAKHEFELWAWVIMPEHVHMLIWPRHENSKTDKILASIKKPVGYKAIQFLKKEAPAFLDRLTIEDKNRTYHHFWQTGPGYDKNLLDTEAIYNAVEYIHANPVRRKLAAASTDWPWSSARDWAGLEHPHPTVNRTLPPLHPDRQ